jgi:ATP-dependent exoDNAse (exonuclease V) alpha subunit
VNDYDFLWGLSKYALVTAFGDYEQLLPVGSDRPYNAPQYINALFARVDTKTLTINRRNDFSFDFYDKMIWDDCDSSIIIKTYCKTDLADYQPTDICIARTNAECDKINADILEMLFDTRDMCVGCKVECRTNNLRDIDVYNHYQFEIVSMNDEQVILSDNIRELTITPRQLRNNFTPAYCVTLHSAQGKSYPVVRYMSENLDLTGRELYTLISRIKTK